MGKDRKSYVGAYMPNSLHHPRHIDTRARGAIYSTTYHIYTAGVRTANHPYYEVVLCGSIFLRGAGLILL
jgi:hypothetical protein